MFDSTITTTPDTFTSSRAPESSITRAIATIRAENRAHMARIQEARGVRDRSILATSTGDAEADRAARSRARRIYADMKAGESGASRDRNLALAYLRGWPRTRVEAKTSMPPSCRPGLDVAKLLRPGTTSSDPVTLQLAQHISAWYWGETADNPRAQHIL